MTKFRLLDGKDMDSMRMPANPIWNIIHKPITMCFGRLAFMCWGTLFDDDFLLDAYVKEYEPNTNLELMKQQLNFLRFEDHEESLKHFSMKYKHYVNINALKCFDDFDINSWLSRNRSTVLAFLGDKGVGKTTFIMYLSKQVSSEVIMLMDNLASASNEDEARVEIYRSLIEQIDKKVMEIGKELNFTVSEIINRRFQNEFEKYDAVIYATEPVVVKEEKEKRRSLAIERINATAKTDRESILYLNYGISFLKSHGKRICIVFDDIDRIPHKTVAEWIRREAHHLSETLHIPIILCIREITAKKNGR